MASRSSNTVDFHHHHRLHYGLPGLSSPPPTVAADISTPPNGGLVDAAVDRYWSAAPRPLTAFRADVHSPVTMSVALFDATAKREKPTVVVTALDPPTPSPADRSRANSCPLCGVRFGLESGKAAPKRLPGCGHNFCAECIFSQCLHREYYLLEAINCVRCGAECEARAAMNAPIDYALCERLMHRHNGNNVLTHSFMEKGADCDNHAAPQLNQSAADTTATSGAGNNITVIRVPNAPTVRAADAGRRRRCAVVAPTPQRPPAKNWASADGSARKEWKSENNGRVYDLSAVDVKLVRMVQPQPSPNVDTNIQKDRHSDYGSGGSMSGGGAAPNATDAKCVECRMACRRVTCVRRAINQLSARFDVDATEWRRQRGGGDGNNDDDLLLAFEESKSLITDETLSIIGALAAHRHHTRRNCHVGDALIHEETGESDTAYSSSAASASASPFRSRTAAAKSSSANVRRGGGRRDVYRRLRRERTQKMAALARQLSALVPVVETAVISGRVAVTTGHRVDDAPHFRLSAAAKDASMAIYATLALLRVVQPTSSGEVYLPHPYSVSASAHFLSLEKCATALTAVFGNAAESSLSAPGPSSYLDVEEPLRGAARALTWLISANERIAVPIAAIPLISAAFTNCFRALRLAVALRGSTIADDASSSVASPSRRRRRSSAAAVVECHRRSWKAAQIGYGELLRCASTHWHSAAAPQRVAIVAELAGVCALFADVCDTATILVCMIEAARARAATPFTDGDDAVTVAAADEGGGEGGGVRWRRRRRGLSFHLKRIDDRLAECRRVQKLAELRSRTRLAKRRSVNGAGSPGAISTSCVVDVPFGGSPEESADTPQMAPSKEPKRRRTAMFLRRLVFAFSAPFEKKASKVTAV